MLPELTSRRIVRFIKRCCLIILQKLNLDYVNVPCLRFAEI